MRSSPPQRKLRQAYVTSSSGRCRNRSSPARCKLRGILRIMELSGEARIKKPRQVESGGRPVSGLLLMQLPRGLRLLLHDQNAAIVSGELKALQKARLTLSAGRAKRRTRRGAARDGNNPPAFQDGAVPQTGITQLQVERSLRGKRSDPSHGANALPEAVAVPVVKVPVRTVFLQASQHPSGERTTGRWSPNRA